MLAVKGYRWRLGSEKIDKLEPNDDAPKAAGPSPNRMVIRFRDVTYIAVPEDEYLEMERVLVAIQKAAAVENVFVDGGVVANMFLERQGIPLGLSDWRKQAKMSQLELAKRVGISQSFLGQIETGKKHPNVQLLSKLSQALNVSMDLLARAFKDPDSKTSSAA